VLAVRKVHFDVSGGSDVACLNTTTVFRPYARSRCRTSNSSLSRIFFENFPVLHFRELRIASASQPAPPQPVPATSREM
jgi:hypothetical protein